MYLLATYQSLEINLIHLILHGIKINFLYQDIHHLTFQIQHHLATLGAGLHETFYVSLAHLHRNGAFDFSAEYITGYISFPSKLFCLCAHVSFFSF